MSYINSKNNQRCELCYNYLRVFINDRDWDSRKYHKKCWKNMNNNKCILCEDELDDFSYKYYCKHNDCDLKILYKKGYKHCKNEECDNFLSPESSKKWDYCRKCDLNKTDEIFNKCLL